jgi:protein-S-isoprenylcysteine O-methyltransferase Ste14
VLFPLGLFISRQSEWPSLTTTGVVFSALAGVAGAVGAICVIFATKAAFKAAEGADTYKLFIAPLIFALAPVINTIVSSFWQPKTGQPFHFAVELPGWKLWVGIVLVGLGAGLVLYSKEESESSKKAAVKKQAPTQLAVDTSSSQAIHKASDS